MDYICFLGLLPLGFCVSSKILQHANVRTATKTHRIPFAACVAIAERIHPVHGMKILLVHWMKSTQKVKRQQSHPINASHLHHHAPSGR